MATKSQARKLVGEEMQGGTFTITNSGVFGSLMNTPIINSLKRPSPEILRIEAPIVVDKQIVIRPMMYVALSYDHRVDGRESVLENPDQLLFSKDAVRTLLEL